MVHERLSRNLGEAPDKSSDVVIALGYQSRADVLCQIRYATEFAGDVWDYTEKKQVLDETLCPPFMDQKKLRLVLSEAHVQVIRISVVSIKEIKLTLCGIVKGCVCTCEGVERRYVNIRIIEGLGWNRCSESVE